MSTSIYKYVGGSYRPQVLGAETHVTLKCSYPQAFNDPYELFLTVDFNDSPEALASYAEIIGELPQIPTTCFSHSPIVTPMWAHYAKNLQGFVIEFDESKLADSFPESGFGDVDYQDGPNPDLSDLLHRAYVIKKPRYVYMLREAVRSAAYFTKATCWGYEQERRMLVREAETRRDGELILMDVPKECVTALLCGPRASADTVQAVQAKALELGCRYLELKVGRSSPVPFFVDSDGYSVVFSLGAIQAAECACGSCGEPLLTDDDKCSWCQITEAHADDAARSNPYRILDHAGMLDSYVEEMDEITRRHRGGHGSGDEG